MTVGEKEISAAAVTQTELSEPVSSAVGTGSRVLDRVSCDDELAGVFYSFEVDQRIAAGEWRSARGKRLGQRSGCVSCIGDYSVRITPFPVGGWKRQCRAVQK